MLCVQWLVLRVCGTLAWGQQAHASRYQTQQLTAGQLHKLPPRAVITVWAVPHRPRDTQLGPTETIFNPLHWCCWQGDSKPQDSLAFLLWDPHPPKHTQTPTPTLQQDKDSHEQVL